MTPETVQIVSAVLCVALVGIIIMRRKAKKKAAPQDDF